MLLLSGPRGIGKRELGEYVVQQAVETHKMLPCFMTTNGRSQSGLSNFISSQNVSRIQLGRWVLPCSILRPGPDWFTIGSGAI